MSRNCNATIAGSMNCGITGVFCQQRALNVQWLTPEALTRCTQASNLRRLTTVSVVSGRSSIGSEPGSGSDGPESGGRQQRASPAGRRIGGGAGVNLRRASVLPPTQLTRTASPSAAAKVTTYAAGLTANQMRP